MNHPNYIKAIIGLGNPGPKFQSTRHNIGFAVVDQLAVLQDAKWEEKPQCLYTFISLHNEPVLLIKPQTFMNASGKSVHFILKKGIKPEEIVVVHDELEMPFGKVKFRFGGSARGHNGLRSIIEVIGKDFWRLGCGIGRPDNEDVGTYVLQPFTQSEDVQSMIDKAVNLFQNI